MSELKRCPFEVSMTARIAELKGVIEILEDQRREAKNILIDKKLHIDSLYEEGYKLQQRIAELEEKQRWIPVSERLPEETGLYLVWQDSSFAVGYRVLYYSAGRIYLDFLWTIVTHWMPLPTPPEVQE